MVTSDRRNQRRRPTREALARAIQEVGGRPGRRVADYPDTGGRPAERRAQGACRQPARWDVVSLDCSGARCFGAHGYGRAVPRRSARSRVRRVWRWRGDHRLRGHGVTRRSRRRRGRGSPSSSTRERTGRRYDDYGHGTHVAGIVGGNGFDSAGARSGIAPGVRLLALKGLSTDSGNGSISSRHRGASITPSPTRTRFSSVVDPSVSAGG